MATMLTVRRIILSVGVIVLVTQAPPYVHLASPGEAGGDDDAPRALAQGRARADAGDVVAQFSVGTLLYYGSENLTEAVARLQDAAAKGHPPAEFQVGQLYDFGFGVAQSDAEAFKWYRLAAEHGNAPGQRTVAEWYAKPRHVAQSYTEALRWYRLAADRDDIRAQYELGQMCLDGTGMARDNVSAYLWFSLAADQAPLDDNHKALVELRNIAEVRMTPEQVARAKALVSGWKATPSR